MRFSWFFVLHITKSLFHNFFEMLFLLEIFRYKYVTWLHIIFLPNYTTKMYTKQVWNTVKCLKYLCKRNYILWREIWIHAFAIIMKWMQWCCMKCFKNKILILLFFCNGILLKYWIKSNWIFIIISCFQFKDQIKVNMDHYKRQINVESH